MDKQEAKKLYKEFSSNADCAALGMFFDDDKKQLFIKEDRWQDCRLIDYKNIAIDVWNDRTATINKGHPIIGSIIGNAIGGFATGLAGALIGQQAEGKKKTYVDRPSVSFSLYKGEDFTHVLLKTPINKNGVMGKEYQRQLYEVQDKLESIVHPWAN